MLEKYTAIRIYHYFTVLSRFIWPSRLSAWCPQNALWSVSMFNLHPADWITTASLRPNQSSTSAHTGSRQGLVQYQTANCDTQLYASHSLGHNLVLILDVLLVILFQVKLGLSALCSTSYWCASCLLLNMPPWKHSKWVRTLLDMSLKQFEKGEEKISHSKNHQPDTPREY